jgi:hypothetical protein
VTSERRLVQHPDVIHNRGTLQTRQRALERPAVGPRIEVDQVRRWLAAGTSESDRMPFDLIQVDDAVARRAGRQIGLTTPEEGPTVRRPWPASPGSRPGWGRAGGGGQPPTVRSAGAGFPWPPAGARRMVA